MEAGENNGLVRLAQAYYIIAIVGLIVAYVLINS
jgi:hypothetical protein